MIGDLDQRITLQSYTASQNDTGEEVNTYSTLATVWAQVRYASGDERIMADREVAVADCIFKIRYRSTVTEKTRILFGTTTYDILHIADRIEGRMRYMELTAKKIV